MSKIYAVKSVFYFSRVRHEKVTLFKSDLSLEDFTKAVVSLLETTYKDYLWVQNAKMKEPELCSYRENTYIMVWSSRVDETKQLTIREYDPEYFDLDDDGFNPCTH